MARDMDDMELDVTIESRRVLLETCARGYEMRESISPLALDSRFFALDNAAPVAQ